MRAYEIRNNSVLGFIYDYETEENTFVDKTTTEIYYEYQRFCRDNGLKAISKMGFCKQINRRKGLKVIVIKNNGRCERVFAEF